MRQPVAIQLMYFIVFSIFAEIAFTVYTSVFDSFNLLGHVYKTASYYFLFRAVYLSGVIDYFYTMSEMAKMSAEILNDNITLEQVLSVQMTKLKRLLPHAERIAVYFRNGGDTFKSCYVWGKFEDMLSTGREIRFGDMDTKLGLNVTVLDNTSKIAEELSSDAYTPELATLFREAYELLYLPLTAKGSFMGFIFIYTFLPTRTFSSEDIEKATVFQRFAALAIAQVKSRDTITRLSYTDILTSLPNRRYFFDEFNRVKFDADNHNLPFTVIYADMNDLKYINDYIGHDAGDKALATVGDALRQAAGASGVPARLGGDEFALIYRHMDLPAATTRIEELKKVFTGIPIPGLDLKITLAIGGASYPIEAHTEEDLLKLADDRMYEHKRFLKEKSNAPV